jgi:hypothetical protein
MAQAETIREGDALPAPVIPVRTVPAMPPPVPKDPKLKREYETFLRLYPELLKALYGNYVAIHEGQVVDSGEDKLAVAAQAYARHGYVPIYVHLVTDQPQQLDRIPSPRLADRKSSSA